MLEEYLRQNLEESGMRLEKENKKLIECLELEKTIRKQIRNIQQNTDIDFEIFSPRAGDSLLKGKVKQLYENVDLLKSSIAKLQSNIEKYTNLKNDFTVMLKEWENLKVKAKDMD